MFLCFGCDKSFLTAQALTAHVSYFHTGHIAAQNLQCKQPDCYRKYSVFDSYRKHMISHNAPAGINIQNKRPRLSENNILEPEVFVESANIVPGLSDDSDGNISPPVNSLDFDSVLANAVITYIASLYDSHLLTGHQIQQIINGHKQLLGGGFLSILKDHVMALLTKSGNISLDEQGKVNQMFESCINMYDGLDSEHLRMTEFENSGAFIKPESFVIGSVLDEQSRGGGTDVTPVQLTGEFIPLRKVLKGFFELPRVCEKVLKYMEELENCDPNVLSNVIQGEVWKNKVKPRFDGKTVLPLLMYYDEYETNKEFATHTGVHKMGATYAKVDCLPPEYQSALENIFLFSLFHAGDRKLGNRKAFRKVLSELEFLEKTGVTVVTPTKVYQLYFALSQLSGDNLGLNALYGLVECFVAKFYCRICKEEKKVMEKQTESNPAMFRNRDNYTLDVLTKNESETGVKEECVFNDLSSFHVTENLYLDTMHDLDEGVWNYCMVAIIRHLINSKVFILQELNNLIQGFYYGASEQNNKPPLITKDHINRNKLSCSASEMRCLYRYFGLIVGHLVSDENPAWKLYIIGRRILDIVTSPKVTRDQIPLLKGLIKEHHALYLRFFNDHLYPKMHFMVHEPEVISLTGPLEPVACIRMEGKHKEGKEVSRSSYNRINLPYTIAKRHQLQLCFRFLAGRGLTQRLKTAPIRSVSPTSIDDFEKFRQYLPQSMLSDDWLTVTWASIQGTEYSLGMVVIVKMNDENDEPVFGKIRCIALSDQGTVVNFLLQTLNIVKFDSHYFAYEVNLELSIWYFVRHDQLLTHVPAELRLLVNGKRYVALRHSI